MSEIMQARETIDDAEHEGQVMAIMDENYGALILFVICIHSIDTYR